MTGLYFYDNQVLDIARDFKPSPRGRTGNHRPQSALSRTPATQRPVDGRGHAWLDTGTHESARGQPVHRHHRKTPGLKVACPGKSPSGRAGSIPQLENWRTTHAQVPRPISQSVMHRQGVLMKAIPTFHSRRLLVEPKCSATNAGSSSKVSTPARFHGKRPGSMGDFVQDNHSVRPQRSCAACIISWAPKGRASWSGRRARSSTWPSICPRIAERPLGRRDPPRKPPSALIPPGFAHGFVVSAIGGNSSTRPPITTRHSARVASGTIPDLAITWPIEGNPCCQPRMRRALPSASRVRVMP